jgi:4-amino-4-deoxy-L-arabinose transferase-like glycosyltransferase
MKIRYWLLLSLIFIFAFVLRTWFLKYNALTFLYDQARDAYVSQEIIKGDLKILGPPSSTPGLYHGVFYYYVLAPAYLVGHGSPITAAYWIAFLNCSSILIVYYLAFLMTKKHWAGILAAFFCAVSYEATQYATWLSNPTLGFWTVPLMYLGLWLWTREKKSWGVILAGIGLGLSIQADVFLVYQAVPLSIWLWLNRKRITRSQIVMFGVVLLLCLSTMIVSEVKFGFKSVTGLASILSSNDALVAAKGLGDFLVMFVNQLGKTFSNNSYPGNVGYGGILIIFLICYWLFFQKRQKALWPTFLTLWLFSHFTVVFLGGTSTPFLLVGIGPAVSILLGISVYFFRRPLGIVLALVVVTGNLFMIFKQNSKGSVIFAIQKDMLLSKQLAAVDYTYTQSSGKFFSINSITSPLWINIVWDYLYKWYGEPKYGYLPQWHGRDQVGQLGSLPLTVSTTKNYFLIQEPLDGIPDRFVGDTLATEDSVSRLVGEASFGDIRVQTRERIK